MGIAKAEALPAARQAAAAAQEEEEGSYKKREVDERLKRTFPLALVSLSKAHEPRGICTGNMLSELMLSHSHELPAKLSCSLHACRSPKLPKLCTSLTITRESMLQ